MDWKPPNVPQSLSTTGRSFCIKCLILLYCIWPKCTFMNIHLWLLVQSDIKSYQAISGHKRTALNPEWRWTMCDSQKNLVSGLCHHSRSPASPFLTSARARWRKSSTNTSLASVMRPTSTGFEFFFVCFFFFLVGVFIFWRTQKQNIRMRSQCHS